MKKQFLTMVTAMMLGSSMIAFAAEKALITDDSLGVSKTSVTADTGLVDKPFIYQGTAPGAGNERIPRAYDNAPPMIPHDINELPIITQDMNMCVACHMPDAAKGVGATPIPPSHMTNLRNMTDLKGELYQGRYNCTACHAPQAVLEPAVMNKFKGAYHKKIGGEYKTNLMQTLREGVVPNNMGSFDLNKDLMEEDKK